MCDATHRQRFFGELERSSSDNYAGVWSKDAVDAGHSQNGVEPAVSVVQRACDLLLEIEKAHARTTVLLVAHGDVLQLLQTAFRGVPPERHRTLTHLETAEIRELTPTIRSPA